MRSKVTHKNSCYILVFGCLFSFSLLSAQTVRYVKPLSSGLANGSSWINAADDLQLVINNSSAGDQIWVAAGTYKPARRADDVTILAVDENDTQRAFVMTEGVQIYGSFVGTETNLAQRILPAFSENITYSSILSGDFLGDDVVENEDNDTDNAPFTILNGEENASHVVIFAGPITSNTILDGFSITGGYADTRFSQAEIIVNEQPITTYVGGGISLNAASPTLSNLHIHHNSTSAGGGGLYLSSSSPIMSNILVNFNRSTGSGAGVYASNSSPNISNIIVSTNFAWVTGAGLYCGSNSNLIINNGVINQNNAFSDGGGVLNADSSPTFTNTTISNNSAQTGGGMQNYNSAPILTNVIITANNSNSSGGGIYSQISEGLSLNNVSISNNISQSGNGGGLTLAYNSTASLENCMINGNINGGIHISLASSLSIIGGSISNNESSFGGGIYIDSTIDSHLTNVLITSNSNGGVINKASPSTYTNCTVSGNQDGAGMYIYSSAPILTNMIIINNTSPGEGGGLRIINASPTISFTTVENNSAMDGGGIYISNSTANFTNTTVNGNQASTNGGGIYSNLSNSTLSNLEIKGNSAANGSGIFNLTSNPIITNTLISGNHSLGRGGGIYNNMSSPIITNATIVGNNADQGFGAMYNETVGVNALPTNPSIRNSIIWGNSSGINMGCVTCNPVISYSLVQAVTVADVNNNFASEINPLFIDSPSFSSAPFTTGNYYLQTSSTLLNVGNNLFFAASQVPDLSLLITDLDGNQRIQENLIDLGAYENNSSLGLPNSINKVLFTIYPNPIKDKAQIKSSIVFNEVEFIDSMGRMVCLQKISNNTIDMSGLAIGIYIVNAYSNDTAVKFKVVKQ